MISCKKQLCALVLVSACAFGSVQGKPYQTRRRATNSTSLNLKGHQRYFNTYHARMVHEGKADQLSAQFLAVHDGMKNGIYEYDLETAQAVAKEVYAHRQPIAHPSLFQTSEEQAPKAETLVVENSSEEVA